MQGKRNYFLAFWKQPVPVPFSPSEQALRPALPIHIPGQNPGVCAEPRCGGPQALLLQAHLSWTEGSRLSASGAQDPRAVISTSAACPTTPLVWSGWRPSSPACAHSQALPPAHAARPALVTEGSQPPRLGGP